MLVSLIAAMSENRVIGKNGELPWKHILADWENLFRVTAGKKMIMGRKSYDSPHRIWSKLGNIVITRQTDFIVEENFKVANSLEKAFEMYQDEEEVFVLGGEELFKQALPFADFLYLSIIHETFEGDAFFPVFDEKKFQETEKKIFKIGEDSPYNMTILKLERIKE